MRSVAEIANAKKTLQCMNVSRLKEIIETTAPDVPIYSNADKEELVELAMANECLQKWRATHPPTPAPPPPPPMLDPLTSHLCAICGALRKPNGKPLKSCALCSGGAYYCCEEHQRDHWKHHRVLCAALVRPKSRMTTASRSADAPIESMPRPPLFIIMSIVISCSPVSCD